ncbi:MAG: rhodanese-like domain-containing protein [Ornithinimicrobium sp.]|uniref:rhodanese-like domain-containing protein n=1 Tax=Ornithinimicrobium sp. TaxID=1977084 RepID=UPI0026DFD506|nr:rhodanese-like domain-containing protein [Ornithinimicrobium sp.]MDO5740458.1 rhodanese-like domain-containing protein [Ornithinimicrobium sp.]
MNDIPTVAVTNLSDDALIVDVREPDEWAAGHAPGALHLPLGDIPSRLDELPETDRSLAIICRSGGRSGRAVQWLVQQGFDVVNVEGGMRAWRDAGKPVISDNGQEPTVV